MNQLPPGRILVAYDFSARCRSAWAYAQDLARRFGGAVEAIHVREWLTPDGGLMQGSLPAAIRAQLAAMMSAEIPGGVSEGYHVVEGSAARSILSFARGHGVDLVVLVSEAREGARRFAKGSTADAMIRESKVPVLTLYEDTPRARSVLLPVDLLAPLERAVEYAASSASALGAKLTLMHCVSGRFAEKGALKRLEARIAALPERLRAAVQPSVKIVEGDPAHRVCEESATHGLIVLPLHEALGATAATILRYSRAPVLTLPTSA